MGLLAIRRALRGSDPEAVLAELEKNIGPITTLNLHPAIAGVGVSAGGKEAVAETLSEAVQALIVDAMVRAYEVRAKRVVGAVFDSIGPAIVAILVERWKSEGQT